MPHHKSAEKRVRQSAKSNDRNTMLRSRMRSVVRAVRQSGNRDDAQKAYLLAASVLDRTVAKGVIKRETASRHKSRLARFVQKLAS